MLVTLRVEGAKLVYKALIMNYPNLQSLAFKNCPCIKIIISFSGAKRIGIFAQKLWDIRNIVILPSLEVELVWCYCIECIHD